jgi:hypothetical protein
MQAANQFTPDQLIVAGRRAEAQGQPAYALQFYRYVAEHFPSSTEAYEARDALFRLVPPSEQPLTHQAAATNYAAPQAQVHLAQVHPAQVHPAQVHPQQGHPQQASFGEHRPQGEQGTARPRTDTARPRPVDQPASRQTARSASRSGHEATALRPPRGYRIGRLVAAMLNTIGWLSLIAAIALVPLMIAALAVKAFPKALKETIAGNLLAVGGIGFGLLLLGLFAIFAAQVARATFDTADATRALYEANTDGE